MAAAAAAEVERPRILYADAGPEPPYPLRMEGAVISGFGRGSKELGIPTANLPVDAAATPWIESVKSGVYFGYASLALPPSHPDRQHRSPRSHRSHPRAAVDAPPAPLASETSPSFSTSSSTAATKEAGAGEATTAGTTTNTKDGGEGEETTKLQWQIYPMVMSIGYNPFYKNAVRSAEVHVLHAFGADFYAAPMRLLLLGFVREERDYASLDALVTDINVDCDVARRSLARPGWTPREGTADGTTGEFDGAWLVRDE
ncbi:riboflavin kinase [Hypoxylon rubiginosum]|uniref:Riboflavin kinase n=1 Tax=Hypoxylon rubiginosum TaxID=110542 RepID=A0ACC0DFR7_9PEZI|nr:riboflavin kinase [Hypoxylon rubiginosum]